MKCKRVFIVILNWNGKNDTLECLESVYRLNYQNITVLIVDNGSTDDSCSAIADRYPSTTILKNDRNLGYAEGNNLGMKYAEEHGAYYVWLLNNDAIVEENTLSTMIEYCEENSNIGLSSPIIYYYDNPEEIQFCGSYVDWRRRSIIIPKSKDRIVDEIYQNGDGTCLWGTALLVKSDLIRRIGYLDEKLFAYWEDTDYSIRSIKAGYRNAVVADATIFHKVNNRKNPYYYYFMARNEYILWEKYTYGLDRIKYLRQYLSKRLTQYDEFVREGYLDAGVASLDGIWSALMKSGGGWEARKRIPNIIRKVIDINPHLWAFLLQGGYIKSR